MNRFNITFDHKGFANGLILSLLVGGLISITNGMPPVFQILVPCFLTLAAIFLNQSGFAHPLNCCLPFMLLATTYFPMLQWLEGQYDAVTTQVINIHTLFFLGYLTIFLACPLVDAEDTPTVESRLNNGDINSVSVLVYLSLAIGITGLYLVSRLGISSKRELLDSHGFSIGYTFLSFLMLTPFAVVVSEFWGMRLGLKQLVSKSTIWISVTLACAVLISGERDLLFRFLIFMAILLLDLKVKFRRWMTLAILVLIVVAGPASQNLKGIFLKKSSIEMTDFTSVYQEPAAIFSQEFVASGRNLSHLIKSDVRELHGKTYLGDVGRFFYLPGSASAGQWFNKTFRLKQGIEGSSGWGFTLCGEAFINFGYVGVFVFAIVHGLVLSIMYQIRMRSGFHYAIYCSGVFAFIYVQRADLANLLSFTFKSPIAYAIVIGFFVAATRIAFGQVKVATHQ